MEEFIYKKLLEVIKIPYKKISFFGKITDTNYEMFFFVNDGNKDIQCYQLAENGQLDETEIDLCFKMIAQEYRKNEAFSQDKLWIISFVLDDSSIIEYNIEQYEKNERVYKLKKNWIKKHNIYIS